jgi:tetraacyldisaccharide 4'-kinase
LINRCWYGHGPGCLLLRGLLIPFSVLFRLLVALRYAAYRHGLLPSARLPVPVIVVGNLAAGGAGKTPLTLALAASLQSAGYRPGIISRGYGGTARQAMPVLSDSDPGQVGDEPVLMARRCGCPVWIGRKRAEAGRQLLAFHPEVDVLLADDGLQHYALARDVEIAVVDGQRGLGNAWLLPAGPLREPVSRLKRVAAVVCHGERCAGLGPEPAVYRMRLAGERFCNLLDSSRTVLAQELMQMPAQGSTDAQVHAIAGIGHPQRFFDHLAALGLSFTAHAFADHHRFRSSDLPAGPVVMTEKDAVKIISLVRAQARQDCWFLAVDAKLEAGLKEHILSRLRNDHAKDHGPKTA